MLFAGALRDNGLARTPPMGWSSRSFGDSIDDPTMRAIADAMNANGLRQAGFSYLNIDDFWQGTRNGQGDPQPNSRFPDMRDLARYVHSRGLFLGLSYAPANYEHEDQDARTFASWGIDLLHYEAAAPGAYRRMAEDLYRTGRPIVYSIGKTDRCAETGANICQSDAEQTDFVRPGHWLNLGPVLSGAALTRGEAALINLSPDKVADGPSPVVKAAAGSQPASDLHFRLTKYSLLAAPLLVEGDPRTYSKLTLAALTNRELIAIDQDANGEPGFRMSDTNGLEIWSRRLLDGKAVAWFNHRNTRARFTMTWADFGVDAKTVVRDVWGNRALDTHKPEFDVDIDKHDVLLLRVYTAQ
jgi:alpha-galactosidase